MHGAPPEKQSIDLNTEISQGAPPIKSSYDLIYKKWPEFSGKKGENFESWMHQANSFFGQMFFRQYSESEKAGYLKMSTAGARNILEAQKNPVMTF